jgi:hypothetical protein
MRQCCTSRCASSTSQRRRFWNCPRSADRVLPAAQRRILIAFTAVGGQSIGKMALDIKVVSDEDLPVPFGRATLRTLAYVASALAAGRRISSRRARRGSACAPRSPGPHSRRPAFCLTRFPRGSADGSLRGFRVQLRVRRVFSRRAGNAGSAAGVPCTPSFTISA